MDVDHYRALVRPLVEGRKVVITGGPLAGLTDPVELVITLGAERPFVLAFGVGTGALPGHDRADSLVLDVDASDIVSELRAVDAALADLPAHTLAALDRYDPGHEAVVLVMTPFCVRTEIAGRSVLGPRTAASLALEDKVIVDDLWDTFGVRHRAATVVPTNAGALRPHPARARHRHGHGVVGPEHERGPRRQQSVRALGAGPTTTTPPTTAASFLAAHPQRAGDAVPRGHPVQHPRPGLPRRRRRPSPRRAHHASLQH